MNENKIFEGFWDTLITKAKQGAYAVAGAAGSGTAKGKLSVSLLSDAMYSQFKEYLAATGSEVSPKDFKEFLGRMGFSSEFVSIETNQFKKFLNATDPINNPARREPSAAPDAEDAEAQADPQAAPRREQGTIDRKKNRKPFTDMKGVKHGDPQAGANAAQPAANAQNDTSAEPDAEPAQPKQPNAQQQMHQRMQQKRAQGPRARNKTREGVEDDSDVLLEKVSDGALRKFFNTLAQRAMKSGEARSAATKTIANTRTSQGDDAEAAPAQQQAQAQPQASPAQQPAQAQAQPQAQVQAQPVTEPSAPAQPAATPAPAAPTIDYTQDEKAILDRYGNNLPNQIGSADKEVTALARKIMRSAVADYIAQFGGSTPASAQPAAQPQAQPAQQQAQPNATPQRRNGAQRKPLTRVQPATPTQQAGQPNQPAANQSNPQAPAA